jgi:elongation factor P
MNKIFARASSSCYQRTVIPRLCQGSLRLMSGGQKERARNAIKPRALITVDNQPYRVSKIQQGKRGKGGGFVKATMKNLKTGATQEKTYTSDEMVEMANLDKSSVTYSWNDDATGDLVFLDGTTYEEVRVARDMVDNAKYLVEGREVKILSFQGIPFGVELPTICEYDIVSVDATKSTGNTGMQVHPATLESGATIMVPSFITDGRIKVNTEEDKYVERA